MPVRVWIYNNKEKSTDDEREGRAAHNAVRIHAVHTRVLRQECKCTHLGIRGEKKLTNKRMPEPAYEVTRYRTFL